MNDAWSTAGTGAAARRIARAAADGVRTSLLPVNGAAGLEASGFDVVGEVLGTIVMQISWSGFGGCGYYPMGGYGGYGFSPGTVTSSSRTGWTGYAPYVQALQHGRNTAIQRMIMEASALGADGVVGVRLTDERMDGSKREFMALGTAVRSRGTQRPARPFTTDLGGQDVAKLLTAGWVPTGIAYGISVAIRHDDWQTQAQTGVFAGNVEVRGYTELMNHVRADARREFSRLAAHLGADSALLSSIGHHVWELEVGEGHRDHVAECVITGNAVARFHPGAAPLTKSLSIIPLRRTR